jgi:hypothetical protein
MATIGTIDLDKAKLDPGAVFRAPRDVLAASDISPEDQEAILLQWQEDAEALLRATEEGMAPGEDRGPGELLRAVQEAIEALRAKT